MRDGMESASFSSVIARWVSAGLITRCESIGRLENTVLRFTLPNGHELAYILSHEAISRIYGDADQLLEPARRLITHDLRTHPPSNMFLSGANWRGPITGRRADVIIMDDVMDEIPVHYFYSPCLVDPVADKQSAELFRRVAGEEAYRTLECNKPLPITGSLGTKFEMYNRFQYCIRRLKDGIKLCAQVPNVPLWDHLLGIKLVIEHDEPEFLRTANEVVSLPLVPWR